VYSEKPWSDSCAECGGDKDSHYEWCSQGSLAEVDRLRARLGKREAALREISECGVNLEVSYAMAYEQMKKIARAALEDKS
jgi:hypothetical protein